jgi:CubicO group peptidase (beta-lactamase class C family)
LPLVTDIPENHKLSSQSLLQFFSRMEQLQLNVNSFMLLQDGKVTAQLWRPPYRKESPQLLFSLSKTFTSIAVGIAWDSGLLDLDDPVISFFPDKLPEVISPNLARMTIHHLLSMNAGHHDNIYAAVAKEHDWVKAFLSLEVEHEPGSLFRYCTPCTYMLAAIIRRATGQNMIDFLMPRLFEPLGITRQTWETCPLGTTAGGMGLSLTTEEVARFGLMLLNKGVYASTRIVSESFIQLATMEHSDNRPDAKRIDSAQGYGYQIHLCRRGCYRGDGAFGQLCFVAPEANIVIVATSSFKSMNELQMLLDLIYEHILDQLDDHVGYDDDINAQLGRLLANAPAALPLMKPIPNVLPIVSESTYMLEDNPHGLKQIIFHMRDSKLYLQMVYGDARDNTLPFDFYEPMRSKDVFHKDLSLHQQVVITYAAWQNETTLLLTLYYIETPYVVTYAIWFQNQTIDFQFNINVSMNIPEYSATGFLKEPTGIIQRTKSSPS